MSYLSLKRGKIRMFEKVGKDIFFKGILVFDHKRGSFLVPTDYFCVVLTFKDCKCFIDEVGN